MLEALCRQSSTTLDIVHAEDGPPITQRTSGLILLSQKVAAVFETNHVFGEIHFSACERLG